ncbi:hypothetical protein ONZ45_g4094 [Pleurotus djamor]|nr:hypothetical protein ONZ45_g4094 [Pleurotus djamor]
MDFLLGGSFALRFLDWNVTGLDNEPLDLFVYHEDSFRLISWMKTSGYTLDMSAYPGKTAKEILTRRVSELSFTLSYRPDFDETKEYQGVVLRGGSELLRSSIADEVATGGSGIASIIVVLRYLTPLKKHIRVHVCAVSALAGVLASTCTGGMSFISACNAYSLFPRETIKKRVIMSLLTQCRVFNIIPTLRKAGYWTIFYNEDDRKHHKAFEPGFRGLKTNACLRVPIKQIGSSMDTDEVLLESGFYLDYFGWETDPCYIAYDA